MYRLSALLAALCLVVSGCGIIVRPPTAPVVPTVVGVPPDPVQPRPNPVLPPVSTEPLDPAPGQTVVTITFDDGRASNASGAQMLAAHGLAGTFYLNSGNIGKPGYLSLPDVDAIALSGSEIGGHTVNHPDLSVLTSDEVHRQICEDRDTQLAWGFPVRNFAYPFGWTSPEVEQAVQDCGYNSARSLGDLWGSRPLDGIPLDQQCSECDPAELIPPDNPMHTQAPAQVKANWTITDLQTQVTTAMAHGGGWSILTFHGICPTDCSDITTPQALFEEFVTWLADQQTQGHLIVRTVGDVIGGPVAPPVQGPPPTTTLVNPDLEQTQDGVPSCWMQASYGNNKPEFSVVPTDHSGTSAERLVMRDYVDGDAKLLPTEDLGTCAIAVTPGSTPTIAAWYTSTAPTRFSVQYRMARGVWVYGAASPHFTPATAYTLASWTLPPIPERVTAISFGLILAQNGELVTDDYSLTESPQHS